MSNELTVYRRKLPHWESAGSVYFITFSTINGRFLDEESRTIVFNAIKFHAAKKYGLYGCVVMPEHVHLVLKPLESSDGNVHTISEITHSMKSYSSLTVNRHQGRKGQLWLVESYDRIVRDDAELFEKLNYIVNNPVKANLVEESEDYRWLYLNEAIDA